MLDSILFFRNGNLMHILSDTHITFDTRSDMFSYFFISNKPITFTAQAIKSSI